MLNVTLTNSFNISSLWYCLSIARRDIQYFFVVTGATNVEYPKGGYDIYMYTRTCVCACYIHTSISMVVNCNSFT